MFLEQKHFCNIMYKLLLCQIEHFENSLHEVLTGSIIQHGMRFLKFY